MDKISGIMKIWYQSPRKISKCFEIFLESEYLIKQSRTDSDKNHEKVSAMKKLEYSDYYLYNEQFLRLNGTRRYRLTLFDVILNIPVTKRIVHRRIPKNTKKIYLRFKRKNKPFICLTTDLFPMYRKYSR